MTSQPAGNEETERVLKRDVDSGGTSLNRSLLLTRRETALSSRRDRIYRPGSIIISMRHEKAGGKRSKNQNRGRELVLSFHGVFAELVGRSKDDFKGQKSHSQVSKYCILGLKTFLPGEATKFISRAKQQTWGSYRDFSRL